MSAPFLQTARSFAIYLIQLNRHRFRCGKTTLDLRPISASREDAVLIARESRLLDDDAFLISCSS